MQSLLSLSHTHTQSLQSDNVYNVTPEPGLAELIIISQVEDYRVQINLTFTSTHMRDEPTPEQAAGEGVLRGAGMGRGGEGGGGGGWVNDKN